MVVTNKIKYFLLLAVVLLANIQHSFAQLMSKGKSKVKTIFNIYNQSGVNGNQVFDNSGNENVSVIEPMIFIEHQITKETAITCDFVFDAWTAASDTRLDAETGASGAGINEQYRVGGNFGFKTEMSKWSYGGEIGASNEHDYRSFNAKTGISRSFADDNFTLGVGVQYYKDTLSLFKTLNDPINARITTGNKRDIKAISINASQILTRKDIIFINFDYINTSGFLESTSGTVLVSGVREVEKLPDSRDRHALSTKLIHGIGTNSAIHVDYRFYWDTWDINAHTFKVTYLLELNENEDILELFIRNHNQTKAKYFKSSFNSSEEFMTSDSDIDSFNSYEIGASHSYQLGKKGSYSFLHKSLDDFRWNNSIVYAKRSNDLNYAYLQTALGFEF